MPFRFPAVRIPFGQCRLSLKGHRRVVVACIALAFAVALNLLAYVHARAMMRFSNAGERTIAPERLYALGKARILFTGVNLPRPVNVNTPADVGLAYEKRTIGRSCGPDLEVW